MGSVHVLVVAALPVEFDAAREVMGGVGTERPRFARGDQARAVWEWLKGRNRLGELPAALEKIGRTDLVRSAG